MVARFCLMNAPKKKPLLDGTIELRSLNESKTELGFWNVITIYVSNI